MMVHPLAPLIYFAAGFFAAIMALLLLPGSRTKAAPPGKQAWTAIESLRWSYDFDYTLSQHMTAHNVAQVIAYSASRLVERDREKNMLMGTTIEPGSYTIRMQLSANFVRREDGDEDRVENI